MRLAVIALVLAGACWAQCPVTLTPTSKSFTAAGGSDTLVISATTCPHMPVSDSSWITLHTGQESATALTMVSYTVDKNTVGQVRTGHINVLGSALTITQDAAPCTYSLSPAAAMVPTGGGSGSVALTTNCAWSATSGASWLVVTTPSGNGNATVNYMAAANTGAASRSATINFGGATFPVSQAGVGCSYAVDQTVVSFTGDGGTGKIAVTTDATCAWTTTNSVAWITNLGGGATGPGSASFTVAPNTSPTARSTVLAIAGQRVTVNQAGQGIVFSAGSVTNAASFQSGPIAPGEIITIFGTGLGPSTAAGITIPVSTNLGGTQVLFDGLAAPMIFSSATQLSAIVPYSLAGAVTTQMQVVFQGTKSAAVAIPVAASVPAIFTVPSKGTGPGAVLNQDYSVNSAANPAARGSVVQIFATGGGALAVPVADGSITAGLGDLFLATTAQLGGLDSNVLYAGAAPGLVSGVIQVNVLVPMGVNPDSSVPLAIWVGANRSPVGVTVAIQ